MATNLNQNQTGAPGSWCKAFDVLLKKVILRILLFCLIGAVSPLSQEVRSGTDSDVASKLAKKTGLAVCYDPIEKPFNLGITKHDANAGFRRTERFDMDDLEK